MASILKDVLDNQSAKLISFPDLKSLVEMNCACKHCHSPIILLQETFGLATNLCLVCTPADKCFSCHWDTRSSEPLKDGKKDEKPDTASNYLINHLLVLAMQQLGLGLQSIATFLSVLGLWPSIGSVRQWNVIQEAVGVAEEAKKRRSCSKHRCGDHSGKGGRSSNRQQWTSLA